MAILAQRKRVIDTFVAEELARASRKLINNTDEFRALKGEYVYKKNNEFAAASASSQDKNK